MNPKIVSQNKGFIFLSILIVTIFVLEIVFRDDLVNVSLDFIVTLQTKLPDFTKYLFHFGAGLADPDIILPVYLLVLSLQINKFFLVRLGLYIASIGYFLSVSKAIYESPRPYWLRPYIEDLPGYIPPGIHPLERYAEYGNPSGHAFFSVAFYGYMLYVFIKSRQRKIKVISNPQLRDSLLDEEDPRSYEQKEHEPVTPEKKATDLAKPGLPLSRTMFGVFAAIFLLEVALVGTSRLYLGMHSLNQILLGMSFGGYFIYIFVKFVDLPLENFLKTIAKQRLNNRSLTLWFFSICYVVASFIPVIIFLRKKGSNSIASSDLWSKWWAVVKTELPATKTHAFAYIRCMLDSGVCGGFFGILLGALASNGSYTETVPHLKTIPKGKILMRVFVFMAVTAIPAGILALIPIPDENYILIYVLNWNLALFMAGFSATHFVPKVYSKLGLDIDGDFLRFQNVDVNFS